jgi:pilus assembly protein CpaC
MFTAKGLSRMGAASILVFVLLFSPPGSWAIDSVILDTHEPKKLQLVSGKSIILRSPESIERVSSGQPIIANVRLLSPYEVLVTGNYTGITNLIIWRNKKVSVFYDLEVVYDISRLRQKLHEVLPNETDLRVHATQDSITLSGTVSSTANLSQAVALAESYAGYVITLKKRGVTDRSSSMIKEQGKSSETTTGTEWLRDARKVCNLVQVAGCHQVMLEVRVAEMSKSLTNRLGIDFIYSRGSDLGISALSGLFKMEESKIFYSLPNVKALFRFSKGSATWTGFVDALKEDGLVKILAEPTLIALSGQTAHFLAGGEIPMLVPQDMEQVTVEYKPFGVSLSFTPTVLSENKISIKVEPVVSEIDYSIATQVLGYSMPGFRTRKASTTVELADGQSFAIAGLLDERIRDKMSKIPLLGDIPVLGTLFRSREFQKSKTELIIIVRPHLVKPLDLAKQTLPTDFYIEPDDMELYILGLMEGREKNRPSTVREKLDGDFGHVMPYPD